MKATRLLLVIPLLLAACGGGGSPTAGAPTSPPMTTPAQGEASGDLVPPSQGTSGGGGGGSAGDAALCSALTVAEVSAAAGVEATATLSAPAMGGQFTCNYNAPDSTPVVGHVYMTTEAAISPSQMFDGFALQGEAISGVGDRAVWVPITETEFGSLYVMVGQNLYTVSVLSAQPDTLDHRKTASIELAKLAIPRLP